ENPLQTDASGRPAIVDRQPIAQGLVQLVLGFAIAAAGVLFTLDNLNILHARDYLRYWPLALVVVGIAQIMQARTGGRVLSGSIWIAVGGTMLANRLGLWHVNLFAFWPLILVLVGGRIFWSAFHRASVVDPSGGSSASA